MTLVERLIQKGFDGGSKGGSKEGFGEGFKEGALEAVQEAVCRLRDMGRMPERIQGATGLSGEGLKKLFPGEQWPDTQPGCESRSHVPYHFPQSIFQLPDDICPTRPLHVRQQVTD